MAIPLLEIYAYVLIFLRVGGIYFALPVFGDQPTPLQVRILLSLATACCLIPVVEVPTNLALPVSIISFLIVAMREVVIGIIIGFAARLAFDGLVMAASIVGYQMGFGTANLLVPDAAAQMNSFTAFHRVIMIMIFFALNMHHTYLIAIDKTFEVIPLSFAKLSPDLAEFFIHATGHIFVTAIQLAAPVLVALMFTMASLGLIARTVPQMNVFTMSFPLSFFIGLLVYLATFPLMPGWLNGHFQESQKTMLTSIYGMR